MKLTPRKAQILCLIQWFIKENNYSPTVRELCGLANLKSTSTMHRHLMNLQEMGVIKWEPLMPRTIDVVQPMSGDCQAC